MPVQPSEDPMPVHTEEDGSPLIMVSQEANVPTLSAEDAAVIFDLEEPLDALTEAAEHAAAIQSPMLPNVPREPTDVMKCTLAGAGLAASTVGRETSFEVRHSYVNL